MLKEAEELYRILVADHGMPENKSLTRMGDQWYLIPDEINTDPAQPISTAVFRPLQPEQAAAAMALYASEWALTFVQPEDEQQSRSSDPVTRLKQVINEASRR